MLLTKITFRTCDRQRETPLTLLLQYYATIMGRGWAKSVKAEEIKVKSKVINFLLTFVFCLTYRWQAGSGPRNEVCVGQLANRIVYTMPPYWVIYKTPEGRACLTIHVYKLDIHEWRHLGESATARSAVKLLHPPICIRGHKSHVS